MSEKINLSLDEIIAKEGITAERKPNLTKRVVKSDTNGLQNVVFEVNNDSSVRSTKRKAISEDESCLTSVDNSTAAVVKGSHFPPTFGQIFVDNLKYEVNDDDMTQLFGAFGTLKRCAINYQCDGRSAGTAFIVFENRSEAEEAVKSLNNITLDG